MAKRKIIKHDDLSLDELEKMGQLSLLPPDEENKDDSGQNQVILINA